MTPSVVLPDPSLFRSVHRHIVVCGFSFLRFIVYVYFSASSIGAFRSEEAENLSPEISSSEISSYEVSSYQQFQKFRRQKIRRQKFRRIY